MDRSPPRRGVRPGKGGSGDRVAASRGPRWLGTQCGAGLGAERAEREIGAAFGVGPYAVTKAVARFGERVSNDARQRKRLAKIKSNAQT